MINTIIFYCVVYFILPRPSLPIIFFSFCDDVEQRLASVFGALQCFGSGTTSRVH